MRSPSASEYSLLHERDDRFVELVAGDADRFARDDATERDHRDLGGAAADVDDHVAGRLVHREPRADRRGHRLLDDEGGLARAGELGRLLHGARSTPVIPEGMQMTMRGFAHRRWCTRWMKYRSIFSQMSKSAITPSFKRSDGLDVTGRAAEHPLRLDADREHPPVLRVHRDDRRLVEHDAAAAHVHERVGGPEVDGHVTANDRGKPGLRHRDALQTVLGCGAQASRARSAQSPSDARVRAR